MIVPSGSERGAALIFALLGMSILMALGAALVLMTSTETLIASNFRNRREAFYAAEAIGELAVADLRIRPDWAAVLDGSARAAFVDGPPSGARTLPVDSPVDLGRVLNLANCSSPAPCGGPPRWWMFAHGPFRDLVPASAESQLYLVALVAPADGIADALAIRAEAFGPRGSHGVVEITLVAEAGVRRVAAISLVR
jgi:hypothetical protein